MLIDWFTVGAQALNFVILVWLMKRLLYQPILDAIDAREARIAETLADAAAKQAAAAQERAAFAARNEAFDRERARLMSQAHDAADAERRRLLDAARNAAAALAAQRDEALRHEARNLDQAIGQRVQDEVLAIARQALAELAGTDLEARMCEVFIERLRALDGPERTRLAEALGTGPEAACVRSAIELPAAQRQALQDAVRDTLSPDITLRYATTPGLVSGIELGVPGQKVAWSLSDYLASLERAVGELLKPQAGQGTPDATHDESPGEPTRRTGDLVPNPAAGTTGGP